MFSPIARSEHRINRSGNAPADRTVPVVRNSGLKTIPIDGQTREFVTPNTGTLRVRFVVGAPDTLATGDVELPLKKDWVWSISAHVASRNPQIDGFASWERSRSC
jgi:hypothetical protein